MNKIYRLIRHSSTGAWVAVSEITSTREKSGNRRLLPLAPIVTLAFAGSTFAIPAMAEIVIDDQVYAVPGDHPSPSWVDNTGQALIIGDTGTATLEIGDGAASGSVSFSDFTLGRQDGSIGTVIVNGTGSALANRSATTGGAHLIVGDNGTGVLEIINGGEFTGPNISIGHGATGIGSVTVDGAGSQSTTSGNLIIGNEGVGTLTVTNGGVVTSGGTYNYVGNKGNGTVLISGPGSAWGFASNSAAKFAVDTGSTADVTIEQGGTLGITGHAAIGEAGTANILVTGTDSIFSVTSSVTVGGTQGGSGSIKVADSGKMTISANSQSGVILGEYSGSRGEIIVEGAGSTLDHGGGDFFDVSRQGEGYLAIRDGATAAIRGPLRIATNTGASGQVDVTGTDSTLSVDGAIWLNGTTSAFSAAGNAVMNVTGGGKAQSTSMIIGYGGNSTGALTVSGDGSEMTVANNLTMGQGYASTSNLNVEHGATLNSGRTVIGANSTGADDVVANAFVTGEGTQWTNTGDLVIGTRNATAELTIADGAIVDVGGTVSLDGYIDSTRGRGVLNIGTGGLAGTLNASVIEATTSRNNMSGTSTNNKLVNFNHSDDIQFTPQMTGEFLTVNHIGTGTTQLIGANDYGGQTKVVAGTLQAGASNVFSSNSAHVIEAGGTLDLANHDQSVASLDNSGTVVLSTVDHAGTILTVNGNYVADAGTLVLNTVLGDDNSVTDKLVVMGDTRGNTGVRINNIGGLGMDTLNGLDIIDIQGASDGVFSLDGRAVAGSYEYYLHKGVDNGWYLHSQVEGNGGGTSPIDPPVEPVLRSEVAAYLANQTAAVAMFKQTMHERMGEPGMSGRGEQDARGGVWIRARSSKLDAGVVGRQLDTETDLDMTQLGADMQFAVGTEGRMHMGVMGGYGRAKTRSQSRVSDFRTEGEVQGTSLGLYGTWFQHGSDPTGLFLDGWVQYGRYDNEVRGQWLQKEKYDSHTWSGSIEAGYAIALHESEHRGVYLEPQAQVIYTRYRGDAHNEANGTRIARQSTNDTTTRFGIRAYSRPLHTGGNRVQPFASVNWWSGGDEAIVRMNDVRTRHRIADDRYEVRVGAQAELGKGWSGWGSFGTLWGSNDFRDYDGQVGLKYNW